MEIPFANKIGGLGFRIYSSLKGYEFKIALDEKEIKGANSLRNSIFSSAGYSDDLSNLHIDQDGFSTIFICLFKGELVGTVRLIDVSKCSILELFNVNLPSEVNRSNAMELGGLAIKYSHRGGGRIALMGLIACAYNCSLKKGVTWWLCFSKKSQYESFRAINEECQELDQHLPSQLQMNRREILGSWFEKNSSDTMVFIFNLSGVSYFKNIKNIISKRVRQ